MVSNKFLQPICCGIGAFLGGFIGASMGPAWIPWLHYGTVPRDTQNPCIHAKREAYGNSN